MKKVLVGEMTWPEAEVAIKEAKAVIVPLGAVEEHGYHLTLETDNIIGRYVAERLARETGCVAMPLVPYGQVWSAKDFPGSCPIKDRNFVNYIKDICINLEEKGARNIILFSSHWGNKSSTRTVARELYDEKGYKNIYYLSYFNMAKTAEGIMETPLWNNDDSGFHSAEIETSIALYVAPESVDMSKAVNEYPVPPFDVDIRPVSWIDYAKSGVFGDASASTAEKGRLFLDRWLGNLKELIDKIQ